MQLRSCDRRLFKGRPSMLGVGMPPYRQKRKLPIVWNWKSGGQYIVYSLYLILSNTISFEVFSLADLISSA